MGYTTRFDGKFSFSRKLTLDEYEVLQDIGDDQSEAYRCAGKDGSPGGYCQWVVQKGGESMAWDGEEKFYDYEEWLRFLVEKRLKPWGVTVNGVVKWAGKDMDDRGVLRVVDNIVTAEKTPPSGTKVKCPECRHCFYAEVSK